ncbi:MAG: transcriptional repressor [Treponema sp.]|nr:transcriptional repressor [Treponema sp.]
MNYSRQREAILNCLQGRYDHPSADMVFDSVKNEFPNISLGTVYRNLTLLCDTGDIIKVTSVNGVDRFDFNTTPHCHFICSKCTKVQDVDASMDEIINRDELVKVPGSIERTEVMVYGLCQECRENSLAID